MSVDFDNFVTCLVRLETMYSECHPFKSLIEHHPCFCSHISVDLFMGWCNEGVILEEFKGRGLNACISLEFT